MSSIPTFFMFPYFILQDKALDLLNKNIYAYFWSFHTAGRDIFVSNGSLAELFGVTVRCIQERLSQLEKGGYIMRESSGQKRYIHVKRLGAGKAAMPEDDPKLSTELVDEGCIPVRSAMHGRAYEGCTAVHPYNKEYKKDYINKGFETKKTNKELPAEEKAYQEAVHNSARDGTTPRWTHKVIREAYKRCDFSNLCWSSETVAKKKFIDTYKKTCFDYEDGKYIPDLPQDVIANPTKSHSTSSITKNIAEENYKLAEQIREKRQQNNKQIESTIEC